MAATGGFTPTSTRPIMNGRYGEESVEGMTLRHGHTTVIEARGMSSWDVGVGVSPSPIVGREALHDSFASIPWAANRLTNYGQNAMNPEPALEAAVQSNKPGHAHQFPPIVNPTNQIDFASWKRREEQRFPRDQIGTKIIRYLPSMYQIPKNPMDKRLHQDGMVQYRTVAKSPTVQPTFYGFLKTTFDAFLLLEAVLRGERQHAPGRLQEVEGAEPLIASGNVFVCNEESSGIKRWTDGKSWSPSRIQTNFLIYRETDPELTRASKRRNIPRSPTDEGTPPDGDCEDRKPARKKRTVAGPCKEMVEIPSRLINGETIMLNDERLKDLVGSLIAQYPFKSCLMKKTISIPYNGTHHHIVAYYDPWEVLEGKLKTPTELIDEGAWREFPGVRDDILNQWKETVNKTIDGLNTTELEYGMAYDYIQQRDGFVLRSRPKRELPEDQVIYRNLPDTASSLPSAHFPLPALAPAPTTTNTVLPVQHPHPHRNYQLSPHHMTHISPSPVHIPVSSPFQPPHNTEIASPHGDIYAFSRSSGGASSIPTTSSPAAPLQSTNAMIVTHDSQSSLFGPNSHGILETQAVPYYF